MEYILFIFAVLLFVGDAHSKECKDRAPLGINTGQIGINQLTASSTLPTDRSQGVYKAYSPAEGVLGSINSWCANFATDKWRNAYFQVSLTTLTTINGIALQGNVSVENLFNKYQIKFKTEENSNVWHIFNEEIIGQRRGVAYNWFKQSLKATAIRVYAISRMEPQDDNAAFCLRMELFGCLKPGQQLLPLGMETGIIEDNQISGRGKSVYNGRLRNRKPGASLVYWNIDLKQPMKLTSFSSQGCLSNRTYQCHISRTLLFDVYASNNSEFFIAIARPRKFATTHSQVALNTLDTIYGRNITLFSMSTLLHSEPTMKVELYGEHPVCSEVLPYIKPKELKTDTYINSPEDFCTKDWLRINFKEPRILSGIVLQGKSDSDKWVESFKFNYILVTGEEKSHTYKGNIGRSYPLAVNWLPELAIVKTVLIKPIACKNSGCCFRFNIMGCKTVLSSPHDVKIREINRKEQLSWKSPKFAPTTVENYSVSVKIVDPFHGKVNHTVKNTNGTMLNLPSVGNGYKLLVNITAYTKGYNSTIQKTFFFQPKSPGPPSVNNTSSFNGIQDVKSIHFHTSDKNGPISLYLVTFSKKTLSLVELDVPTNLTAKYHSTGPNFTMIVKEGSTFVPEIIEKLDTYANYIVYVRAVTSGQEVSKFGFENKDYIGEIAEFKLERKSLPMLSQSSLIDGKIKITLVKGPPGTRLYQVIVMPLTKNYSMLSTKVYQNITLYDENTTSSIYITAAFKESKYEDYKNFIIGDDNMYTFYKSDETRNVTCRNAKLDEDLSYAVFQRVYVDGLMISSPWLLVHPEKGFLDSNRLAIKFIVSIAVGSILILLIMILTAFCICKRHCRKSAKKEENTSESQVTEDNLYESLCEFAVKKDEDYEIPDSQKNQRYATKLSLGKQDNTPTSSYVYAEDKCEFDKDNFGYEVKEESCYEIIS